MAWTHRRRRSWSSARPARTNAIFLRQSKISPPKWPVPNHPAHASFLLAKSSRTPCLCRERRSSLKPNHERALVSTGFAWWRSVQYLRARESGGEDRMRRLIFGTIIGSLVAIAAVAAAIYYYERPSLLRIAVPRDSDDQAIMAAAAHDFAEARDGIRLKLVAVESLAESSRALQEGHADLAVVRSDLAGRLGMNKGRLTWLVRLSYLGPEIVRALLVGSQSNALTPSRLLRLSKDLPHDWKEQRCFLGFAA